MRAQNLILIEEKETLNVRCLVSTQEKNQLAHKLKKYEGETSDATKKRSRSEEGMIPLTDYVRAIVEIEKKSKDSKVELEKKHQAKIKSLERKVMKETTQRAVFEVRLRQKDVQLSLAIEEIGQLKLQLGIQESTGFPILDF